MVIKNTFLSNSDDASRALRKELLDICNLHTLLDCPGGTFQGAGMKTVVLSFKKGAPTRKIWYYHLDLGHSLGKTNPLNDDDLKESIKLQKTFADSTQSWTINVAEIDSETFDLSVRNSNTPEEPSLRHPQEILAQIKLLDEETIESRKKTVHVYNQEIADEIYSAILDEYYDAFEQLRSALLKQKDERGL